MKKSVLLAAASAVSLFILTAQQGTDVRITITKGDRATIAIPDLRGSGAAQAYMGVFNQTLAADVESSGVVKVAPKSMLWPFIPQQPSDFQTPSAAPQTPRGRRGEIVQQRNGGGRWVSDWSGPPVSAKYLAFGYTAEQNGVFVLYGWMYDVASAPGANPQVIGKRYLSNTVNEAGARDLAHQFAADIIAAFGGKSIFGTHIYFVSSRTGKKEIWVMDPDGKNQRQITHFNSISIEPAVSPDGTKIAFTSYAKGNPGIFVFSVDPVRDLHFYNQVASMNSAPSFTPDGSRIVYASSAGGCCGIFVAGVNGSGFRRLTSGNWIDAEPKVNPKTGGDIVFTSGRSGPAQVYRMNIDGADVERLSEGTGEATNPSWHPEGQLIAFAWTRGYAQGNFNIFVMDVASKKPTQLTHGAGRNEHPNWAPDGVHLVFDSTRGGQSQIYTMLADGTGVQQLTSVGNNERPVWGK
jgi:TolB protein